MRLMVATLLLGLKESGVWSSIGGETKKVTGGWEIEIPISKIPNNQKVTIIAKQKEAHLKGEHEIHIDLIIGICPDYEISPGFFSLSLIRSLEIVSLTLLSS